MRGVERRIEADLDPAVLSVAAVFVSRWDVAVADQVPQELRSRLGIAVATQAYRAYRALVYETPGFETYFRQSTPLPEISDLKIGSRPAS